MDLFCERVQNDGLLRLLLMVSTTKQLIHIDIGDLFSQNLCYLRSQSFFTFTRLRFVYVVKFFHYLIILSFLNDPNHLIYSFLQKIQYFFSIWSHPGSIRNSIAYRIKPIPFIHIYKLLKMLIGEINWDRIGGHSPILCKQMKSKISWVVSGEDNILAGKHIIVCEHGHWLQDGDFIKILCALIKVHIFIDFAHRSWNHIKLFRQGEGCLHYYMILQYTICDRCSENIVSGQSKKELVSYSPSRIYHSFTNNSDKDAYIEVRINRDYIIKYSQLTVEINIHQFLFYIDCKCEIEYESQLSCLLTNFLTIFIFTYVIHLFHNILILIQLTTEFKIKEMVNKSQCEQCCIL